MKTNDYMIVPHLHNAVCKIENIYNDGTVTVNAFGEHLHLAPEQFGRIISMWLRKID